MSSIASVLATAQKENALPTSNALLKKKPIKGDENPAAWKEFSTISMRKEMQEDVKRAEKFRKEHHAW